MNPALHNYLLHLCGITNLLSAMRSRLQPVTTWNSRKIPCYSCYPFHTKSVWSEASPLQMPRPNYNINRRSKEEINGRFKNPLGRFSTPMTFDVPFLIFWTQQLQQTFILLQAFLPKNSFVGLAVFQTCPRKNSCFFMFFHYFLRQFSSVFQSSWLAGLQLQHLPSLESLLHLALGCGQSAADGHCLAF